MNPKTKSDMYQVVFAIVLLTPLLLHEAGILNVLGLPTMWLGKVIYLIVGFGLGALATMALVKNFIRHEQWKIHNKEN